MNKRWHDEYKILKRWYDNHEEMHNCAQPLDTTCLFCIAERSAVYNYKLWKGDCK